MFNTINNLALSRDAVFLITTLDRISVLSHTILDTLSTDVIGPIAFYLIILVCLFLLPIRLEGLYCFSLFNILCALLVTLYATFNADL